MFNKIIIIGRLTQDPELRYLQSGSAVCELNLASNHKYTSNNEKKEEVTYIKVTVFGKQAETCGQYLSKGSQALVEGRLKEDRWEDKGTGQKRSKHVIVASGVRFMDKPTDSKPIPTRDVNDEPEPF